jgi:hypothetical protein
MFCSESRHRAPDFPVSALILILALNATRYATGRVIIFPSRNLNPVESEYALVTAENEFVSLRT